MTISINNTFNQDPLTGLLSRRGLEAYLNWTDLDEDLHRLSLMVVELSRFGSLNESMGGDLGNKIIGTVSKRLIKIFPYALQIARTHGNHFCLIFKEDVDINQQIELLNDFTQRPIALGGEIIVVSIHIGIAQMGASVELADDMLHAAEVALHKAKRDQVKFHFYQSSFVNEAKAAHQLENDLRTSLVTNRFELIKAISNNEFQIVYQPIVDISNQQVHSLEALMRWTHPKRGVISPALFILMAEQIQLMDILGGWVIRRACMDAMTFPLNRDGSRPGVSINVSATQFQNADILLEVVEHALQESGITPTDVKLEITESTAFGMQKIDIVNKLRNMGCMIALDDFGTGFSSLTQLIAIPLDYIKLDTSFISAIGGDNQFEDKRSDRLTRAVLSIAKELELYPIIEGVETEMQCERLKQYGATLMQGYLFSRPLKLDDACNFIDQYNNQ
jgi:diguanylate cyclase (GGDEF)-like protein